MALINMLNTEVEKKMEKYVFTKRSLSNCGKPDLSYHSGIQLHLCQYHAPYVREEKGGGEEKKKNFNNRIEMSDFHLN